MCGVYDSKSLHPSNLCQTILPNLKPSLKKISLRLPELMLEELKALANKRDIPYQSLMKMFLAERIEHELKSASR
ncbi:MAG: hypothetical protein JRJ25_00515 [Deltaproteobacteria bacterium]|nr:hypothetical protein [Deltaproteobacteria bacterium]